MHNPIDRIAHTTAFDTLVVEHWLERENVCVLLVPTSLFCLTTHSFFVFLVVGFVCLFVVVCFFYI